MKCNGITEAFSAERHVFNPSSVAVLPEQSRRSLLQQSFAGRVHQPQGFAGIEGEERNIHFFDDTLQEGGCFNRPDAMLCQQVGQHVDFEREFAKSIVGNRHARAERIVLFPQSADHIGQSLQGTNNLIVKRSNDQSADDELGEKQSQL